MSNSQGNADPPSLTSADYEDIEDAVMETPRGRWFLAEFARRNRTANTQVLLDAIAQLESTISHETEPSGDTAALRAAVCEMAEEISATKREIATIGREAGDGGEIAGATAELDAIVDATEGAASDILEAAEAVQELAWTLREDGVPENYCDALDLRATEIYTACSFQDITGQRTRKVVRLLQNLDSRISTLAKMWSAGDEFESTSRADTPATDDRALLNGPALAGEGVSQDVVDQMMDDIAWADDLENEASQDLALIDFDTADDLELAALPEEDTESLETTERETERGASAPGNMNEAYDALAGPDSPDADISSASDGSLSQKDMDALFA